MKWRTRIKHFKYNDYTEDELVEAYADNRITDEEWDDMWEDRRISSNVYSMGMQELVYREKLKEQSLKPRKNDSINKLNYEVRGFKSGFLEDSIEDNLFTGYMEGGITYPELDVQYRNNMITQKFLDHCVKSRQDYLIQKQLKNYKQPKSKPLAIKTTSDRTEQWLELLHRKNMTEDDWTKLYKGGWIDEATYEEGLDELGIDSEGCDNGSVFNPRLDYKGLKDYDTEPIFTKPLPPSAEWRELGDTGSVKTMVYGTIRKPRGK